MNQIIAVNTFGLVARSRLWNLSEPDDTVVFLRCGAYIRVFLVKPDARVINMTGWAALATQQVVIKQWIKVNLYPLIKRLMPLVQTDQIHAIYRDPVVSAGAH